MILTLIVRSQVLPFEKKNILFTAGYADKIKGLEPCGLQFVPVL